MTIEKFIEERYENDNWDFSFNDLTEVEQNELKAEILQEARVFRKAIADFVEVQDCKYTELPSKIENELVYLHPLLSLSIGDNGTALGVDGWLDIYGDLFAVVIHVDKDGKLFVDKELQIEIDLDSSGADFAYVDTESGEFTNI